MGMPSPVRAVPMLTWRMCEAAVPGMGMRPAGRFMQVRVAMFMAVFMFRIMMVIMPDQKNDRANQYTLRPR